MAPSSSDRASNADTHRRLSAVFPSCSSASLFYLGGLRDHTSSWVSLPVFRWDLLSLTSLSYAMQHSQGLGGEVDMAILRLTTLHAGPFPGPVGWRDFRTLLGFNRGIIHCCICSACVPVPREELSKGAALQVEVTPQPRMLACLKTQGFHNPSPTQTSTHSQNAQLHPEVPPALSWSSPQC